MIVWRHLTLLLAASCFTFMLGLGRAAIGDSDEAFYAEAAREMVESGDWLTPHYNYEVRFQKPDSLLLAGSGCLHGDRSGRGGGAVPRRAGRRHARADDMVVRTALV